MNATQTQRAIKFLSARLAIGDPEYLLKRAVRRHFGTSAANANRLVDIARNLNTNPQPEPVMTATKKTATAAPKTRRRRSPTKPTIYVFNLFPAVMDEVLRTVPVPEDIRTVLAQMNTPKPKTEKIDEPAKVTQPVTQQTPAAPVLNREENVYKDILGVYWYTTRNGETRKFAAVKFNNNIGTGRVLLYYYDEQNHLAYWPKYKMSKGNAGFWTDSNRLGNSFNDAIARS